MRSKSMISNPGPRMVGEHYTTEPTMTSRSLFLPSIYYLFLAQSAGGPPLPCSTPLSFMAHLDYKLWLFENTARGGGGGGATKKFGKKK